MKESKKVMDVKSKVFVITTNNSIASKFLYFFNVLN